MTTILQILAALPALVKTIMELMAAAESAFANTGSGAEKKQTVMTAIEAMINNADLWGKIKALISAIINTVALFNFGSSGKDPQGGTTK